MTFKDAQAELDRLADGKHRTLTFDLTTSYGGQHETKCWVYVDGYTWYRGPTWRDALSELRSAMEGFPQTTEEIPNIEDVF